MAKKAIFQFKIDKHISYLLVKGDKDEKAQKVVISNTELTVNFDKHAYMKVVFADKYDNYQAEIKISDYSLVYKTDWALSGYDKDKDVFVFENKLNNNSNNGIIDITAVVKMEEIPVAENTDEIPVATLPFTTPTKQKTIDLSVLGGWIGINQGEHVVTIVEQPKQQGAVERIVADNIIVIKE